MDTRDYIFKSFVKNIYHFLLLLEELNNLISYDFTIVTAESVNLSFKLLSMDNVYKVTKSKLKLNNCI